MRSQSRSGSLFGSLCRPPAPPAAGTDWACPAPAVELAWPSPWCLSPSKQRNKHIFSHIKTLQCRFKSRQLPNLVYFVYLDFIYLTFIVKTITQPHAPILFSSHAMKYFQLNNMRHGNGLESIVSEHWTKRPWKCYAKKQNISGSQPRKLGFLGWLCTLKHNLENNIRVTLELNIRWCNNAKFSIF